MKNSKNKLPQKQIKAIHRIESRAAFFSTTTTSSGDPTATTSTVLTTTHIFNN